MVRMLCAVFSACVFVAGVAFAAGAIEDTGTATGPGANMVDFTPTGQVVQYNTIADYERETGNEISSFQQSPFLDPMVASGSLPPVQDRLPDEPLVIQPADEIGQYGGTLVDGSSNVAWVEDLLREFPHVYGSNMQGVLPNVFMNYAVSNGGRSYTFNIRPGIKWSDGHPFGADDFMFWWEAIALNTTLNPSGVWSMKAGGEMGVVSKVDDNTITMTFRTPYGVLLERLNRWRPLPYNPAHYLRQFHPDYTDAAEVDATAKEKGFSNWTEMFVDESYWYNNPNTPTIFAWKTLNRGASAPVQNLERNPYFWKIDIAGNQLPYIDKVRRPNLGDQQAKVLKTIAGELDFMHAGPLGYATSFTVLKQNEQRGNYRLVRMRGWADNFGTTSFNMSIDDPVWRELFNNKDFRIALSLGLDRDRINEVVFKGLYNPSQPAPPESSVYNGADPAFKQYTDHDPDRANQILDDLGLTWNSDRSKRSLPDGRPFELPAQVQNDDPLVVAIAELMVQNWEDLGLRTVLRPIDWGMQAQRRTAGNFHVQIGSENFGGQAPIIGALRCAPVPICNSWRPNPQWAQWTVSGGTQGEEPPDDVKRLFEIHEEFVAEPDAQKRFELEQEMYAIHNANMWIIGVINQPGDLETVWYATFTNRMYNIPSPVAPEWYYAVPESWAMRPE